MFRVHLSGGLVNDAHGTSFRHLKSLVVGAVFFGLPSHETNIRDVAHGGHIELSLRLDVGKTLLVDGRIAPIRNQTLGILQFTHPVPHFTRITHDDWHTGINDHIRGDMKVGNTVIGIHHGQPWSIFVAGFKVRHDLFGLIGRQFGLHRIQNTTESIVGVRTNLTQNGLVLVKGIREEYLHTVSKHDRVTHFHHGRLKMQTEKQLLLLGFFNLIFKELTQRLDTHE
mmetsp:Transcript_24972/g.41436  ORF Transcript_24972/g.41436 Transcript_24972/m.41436 type:complete len:226 (-) Transcript_24972:884-1561(-)